MTREDVELEMMKACNNSMGLLGYAHATDVAMRLIREERKKWLAKEGTRDARRRRAPRREEVPQVR